MTDLTNRTTIEIDELVKLYAPALQVSNIKKPEELYLFAIIIDVAAKHIKNKYDDLSVDWKSWCVIAVKLAHEKKKFKYEEEIIKVIDDFVNYSKEEYGNYCSDIALFSSEYSRDLGFVYQFINKKNR